MMAREMQCLRCGQGMELWRREQLQLGRTGWIIGNWGNLLAGALDVDIWMCPHCGKLEFYAAGTKSEEQAIAPAAWRETGEGIAQTQCPYCGAWHDMDDARCPHCHRDLSHPPRK